MDRDRSAALADVRPAHLVSVLIALQEPDQACDIAPGLTGDTTDTQLLQPHPKTGYRRETGSERVARLG